MRTISIAFLLCVFGIFSSCSPQKSKSSTDINSLGLIPEPASVKVNNANFTLSAETKIVRQQNSPEMDSLSQYLIGEIEKDVKLKLNASTSTDKQNSIRFIMDSSIQNPEGYTLEVNKNNVTIKAKDTHGLFYGVQTFLQLLYPQPDSSEQIIIPGVVIQDKPLYKWRGMHLDVSRHFFPVEFIKKMIDVMATLKLNVFHWHLTDDQGWRIEIKKYPKLTEIGGWRDKTVVGQMSKFPYTFDNKRYGGYYTQDQIREVVAYAKARYITIVPEIEMPGHAVAALSAYPEYSCTGGPFKVFPLWGVSDDIYCAGKEKTFQFLEDVLSEIIDLFPGKYIHIGGDECPKTRWKKCPDCQKRIKEEGLKNEEELQGYFTRRIEKFLTSKGKKLVGWDEILDGKGLPESATVMSWRGIKGGITAAKSNHDVVMTPGAFCYFDHYQGPQKYEPLSIGGYTPLEKVYSYNPMPDSLTTEQEKHILGSQANVWTEYILTEKQAEYMVFPRLCALAEVLWTPRENQNYKNFLLRMDKEYSRLDNKNINYRVSLPEGFASDNKFLKDTTTITLTCDIPSAKIRYTTDGSEPTAQSELYKSPFTLTLDKEKTIKAKTFLKSGRTSATRVGTFMHTELIQDTTIRNPANGISYQLFHQEFTSAKNISGKPTLTGIMDTIAIPDSLHSKEWFGLLFNGFIKIPADGVYTFYLNSDDGALLYIDNHPVIDNDGQHFGNEIAGEIALKKGFHSIHLPYFQGNFGSELGLKIESKNRKKETVSKEMLWHF